MRPHCALRIGGDGGARHQKAAAGIDCPCAVPGLDRHVLDFVAVGTLRRTGIVDEDVEPPVAPQHLFDHPSGVGLDADIAERRGRGAASPDDAPRPGCRRRPRRHRGRPRHCARWRPRSSTTSDTTTVTPAAASARAVELPMPTDLPHPVISATRAELGIPSSRCRSALPSLDPAVHRALQSAVPRRLGSSQPGCQVSSCEEHT